MKRLKRLTAVLLCVSMFASFGILKLSSEASDTTENSEYVLNGQKYTTIYADDFSTNEKYLSALQGTESYTNDYWLLHDSTNQNLYFDANVLESDGVAVFQGLDNATTMTDYTVSADVTLATNTKYTSLIIYGNGTKSSNATTGYEFAIVNGSTLRLSYRVNGTHSFFDDLDTKSLLDTVGTTTAAGKTITMAISATTMNSSQVRLVCTARYNSVTYEVFDYIANTDETTIKNTSGAPGFRSANPGGTIDNVVISKAASTDDAILYQDNFGGSEGYANAKGSNTEYWSVADGRLQSPAGSQTTQLLGCVNTTNYTVSATITSEALTANKYCGVVAYGSYTKTPSYGYEFEILNGNYRLYRRSASAAVLGNTVAVDSAWKTAGTIMLSLTAVTNQDGSVTLVGKAACNGVEKTILTYTDSTNQISSGMPGVCSNTTNSSYIEDITVTSCDKLQFTETFDSLEQLQAEAQWSNTAVTVTDGAMSLNDGSGTYLTKITGYADWSNYVFEADVTMPAPTDTESENTATTAIVVGGTSTANGYEFGLMYAAKTGTYSIRLYPRSVTGTGKTETFTFQHGVPVKLKLVVDTDNSKLDCYINGKYWYTESVAVTGTIGLKTTGGDDSTVGGTFDNISIMPIEHNHMDVSSYRGTATDGFYTTHPTRSGYVFGGWYTDASYTEALDTDVVTNGAYAKWVDEDVLTVKAQITAGTTADSDSTDLRLITTVDSLMYRSIGFTVYHGTYQKTKEVMDSTVYAEVVGIADDTRITYRPDTSFDWDSEYFAVCTFTNPGIPQAEFDVDLTVTPRWLTPDGTIVTGTEKQFKVSDGFTN